MTSKGQTSLSTGPLDVARPYARVRLTSSSLGAACLEDQRAVVTLDDLDVRFVRFVLELPARANPPWPSRDSPMTSDRRHAGDRRRVLPEQQAAARPRQLQDGRRRPHSLRSTPVANGYAARKFRAVRCLSHGTKGRLGRVTPYADATAVGCQKEVVRVSVMRPARLLSVLLTVLVPMLAASLSWAFVHYVLEFPISSSILIGIVVAVATFNWRKDGRHTSDPRRQAPSS